MLMTPPVKTDLCCGSSTMSTDPKESFSRELSEFDDKNEILAVKYADFHYEVGKSSREVSAIITSALDSDEDMDSESEPPTPEIRCTDPKICY